MTISKLDALKAAFAQKTSGGGNNNYNNFFPFWKAADDTTTIFRFLPDSDESNPMQFLVENHIHELWINGEKKRVPCLKMYGESCPICTHSAELYAKGKECKEHGDVAGEEKWNKEGKKFYRKLSYIGQGIVMDSPVEHDQDTIVKLVDFGIKIYKVMQGAFQSGDLEKEPYDFFEGYNFRFKKIPGAYGSDYSTSSFAPKQTALPMDVIEKIELFDLKAQRQRYMPLNEIETLLLAAKTGGSIAPSNTATGVNPDVAAALTGKTSIASTSSSPNDDSDNTEEAAKPTANSSVLADLRARAKAKAASTAQTDD